MNTNIDKLHKVLDGKLKGRRVGNTFAQCHLIAGYIELAEELDITQVICKTNFCNDIQYILPILESVLNEHGLQIFKFLWSTNSALVEDCNKVTQVTFISKERFDEKIIGINNYVLVDMTHP